MNYNIIIPKRKGTTDDQRKLTSLEFMDILENGLHVHVKV